MIYTNQNNLPESVVNAIGQPRKPVPERYSATDISNPPLQRYLKEKHWDELTQDVSDMIWMLFGNAMHYVLEKGSPDNAFAEEKLVMNYKGITLSGITDLWHNKVISDYKTTSVYSFLLGDKPEWTVQLNIYRMLYYVVLGMETDKLQIHAILRDWQKSKTFKDANYPKIAFHSVDIPIIDPTPHIDYWLDDIKNPHPCTAEERWERETTWAVMKGTNKTATKVCKTEAEANLYVETFGQNYKVVKRQGEAIRCKTYCVVSQFCEHNPYRELEAA